MARENVAIVTGGSSGIGLAIAGKLVSEGYQTIITGRKTEKLVKVASQLGTNCAAKVLDLADLAGIPSFVNSVFETYGSIDVLVNNAGVNQKKPIFEVSDQDFEEIIRINQSALFSMTREVTRKMKERGIGGSIIHISSMAAHYGIPKVVAYTASKAAVEGMTRAMAVELAPYDIRVNCVAPGFIITPMSQRALNDDINRRNKVLTRTPLGRMGEAGEVANVVHFLASPDSSFITGETIRVDGGNAIGF